MHAASTLVRDRTTDRPLVELPPEHRGMITAAYQMPDGLGGTVARRMPVLAMAGTVCAVFDEEGGAPLVLAVPDLGDDRRYEAYSRILPPNGTFVRVRVGPGR